MNQQPHRGNIEGIFGPLVRWVGHDRETRERLAARIRPIGLEKSESSVAHGIVHENLVVLPLVIRDLGNRTLKGARLPRARIILAH